MKKLLITTAIAFSAVALASAHEEASSTVKIISPTSQKALTGNVAVNAQVKMLRVEMETKIKAIQADYESRIKLLVGDKKQGSMRPDGATTTKEIKKDAKKDAQEMKKGILQDIRQRATSSRPFSSLFDMFKGYFGATVEAEQQ
jgi:Skp family chaperone for outer membrane proteins